MSYNREIRERHIIISNDLSIDETEETVMRRRLCTMSQNFTQKQILNNTNNLHTVICVKKLFSLYTV